MTYIRPGASPCRGTRPAQGADGRTIPPRHYCSREHAQRVEDYRAARQAWEDAREVATSGYATEQAEYSLTNPSPRLI